MFVFFFFFLKCFFFFFFLTGGLCMGFKMEKKTRMNRLLYVYYFKFFFVTH